jgi:soluble lytic murein transglycosylase-like protein
MADEYDDWPTSQNSLGLASNPLMPLGDPMAYARMGVSPDQTTPVDRMFSPLSAQSQVPNPDLRVQSPQAMMSGLVSNVAIPERRGAGEATNALSQPTADTGANQLGGLGQLLQLQGLHDMMRPQAPAAPAAAETPATPSSPTSYGPGNAVAGTSPVNAGQYQAAINASANKWGIDPRLLTSQLFHESGFRSDAVSPAGARGIAQFMPATAKQYGVDPNDPNQSIDGAAHMMKDLMQKYNGNTQLALMGYNWGDKNVDKWLQGKGWQVPQETKDYVKRITGQDIQNPNAPTQNVATMEATTPSQQGSYVLPGGGNLGGLPNRASFAPGSLESVLNQPQGSIPPAGTRENAIGQAKNIFNAQEGAKAGQQTPPQAPSRQPQQVSAAPFSPLNFNQMSPQMQQLWKYMLMQSLVPHLHNINYDPWAVYRLSKEGY